jgi:MFS family permease
MGEERINRVLLFLLINSVYFFSYFQRVGVPGTVFNELQSAFSLSATAVAGLSALTFFIYGGMQIFSGAISDHFGGFRTFLIGGLLLSLSSILFSFSYSPAMLFIMRAFVGFGASFIFISLIKILTLVYESEDFPFYLGISLILGYSGGVFATYPLERAVSLLGWRNSFLIAGLLCSAFTFAGAPVLRLARRVYKQKRTFSLGALFTTLKNKDSLPIVISGAINFGIYFLFQTTLGAKYLQDSFNLSSSKASFFTFVMMLMNTAFAFLSGYTSRLLGLRKPIIRVATGITLTAVIILFLNTVFIGSTKLVLMSYIFLAVSAAVAPVYITTIKEINNVEVAATSVGFLNTSVYLFLSLLIYVSGRILDAFRYAAVELSKTVIYPASAYRMVYLLCVMLALVSFLICFSIKETGDGSRK